MLGVDEISHHLKEAEQYHREKIDENTGELLDKLKYIENKGLRQAFYYHYTDPYRSLIDVDELTKLIKQILAKN